MGYIFGPVPSRRLGWSLGVDLVPYKVCCYDCIYCQLGRTVRKTLVREEYNPPEEILKELKERLEEGPPPDYITLSGSGEPTLNSALGRIIKGIKAITSLPLAVLTNGALFYQPEIRRELEGADLVIPSLDAAREETFQKVNRPCPGLTLHMVLEGLAKFSREFTGTIWLEVMVMKGFNDGEEEVKALAEVLQDIPVERIQLNTVTRPPAEGFALPVEKERLLKIAEMLGPRAEMIETFAGETREMAGGKEIIKEIRELLKRRPCTLEEICLLLGLKEPEASKYLGIMAEEGEVMPVHVEDRVYYKFTGSV
ncbi:MAG TPA: radical SAM protein [Moorella mulderi]|nr:radical SAM protein [Moorella mulderi]